MNAQTKCVSDLNQHLQTESNITGLFKVNKSDSLSLDTKYKTWVLLIYEGYFNLRLSASIIVSIFIFQNQPQGYCDYHVQQRHTCITILGHRSNQIKA